MQGIADAILMTLAAAAVLALLALWAAIWRAISEIQVRRQQQRHPAVTGWRTIK